jgi:hypothetical protein
MFLSSNSFYVLCLFREVVKPLFLLVNVVLLAHLLPLYFFYHRLPLPNSVSIIHCIVQIIARPSLSLGQDAACDKFYNRLMHPLSSINTSLAVAKLLVSPRIQTTGVKGSGYQVHRIPLLLPLFLARPAGAGPRQLSAHALALSPAAPRNARARPCSLTRGTTAIPGQPAQAPARPGPPPPARGTVRRPAPRCRGRPRALWCGQEAMAQGVLWRGFPSPCARPAARRRGLLAQWRGHLVRGALRAAVPSPCSPMAAARWFFVRVCVRERWRRC